MPVSQCSSSSQHARFAGFEIGDLRRYLPVLDKNADIVVIRRPAAEVRRRLAPFPAAARSAVLHSDQLQIAALHVLHAAHEPDDVIACLLEKLADVKKMRLHQKPVLQHDDKLVDLDIGDARLPVHRDGDAPVFLRHQRLPALAPMLLIVGLFLPLFLQKIKKHSLSLRLCAHRSSVTA